MKPIPNYKYLKAFKHGRIWYIIVGTYFGFYVEPRKGDYTLEYLG